jgi:hypothetical protein
MYKNSDLSRQVFKRSDQIFAIPIIVSSETMNKVEQMTRGIKEFSDKLGYSPFPIYNISKRNTEVDVEIACGLPGILLNEYSELGIGINERYIKDLQTSISKSIIRNWPSNKNIGYNIVKFLNNEINYYIEWPELKILNEINLDFTKKPKVFLNISNLSKLKAH